MKFLIVAGGTGGHIYPALSLIDVIKKDPNNKFIYVGTTDRMESEIIPSLNIPYKGLKVHGLKKNVIKNIINVKDMVVAIKESKQIIDDFKPDAVIGFGGYVTFPVLYAAYLKKVPVYLHEQNVIPGKSNKLLKPFATKIFVSFDETKKYLKGKKVIYTGNPCGERAKDIRKHDKTEIGFSKDKKLILIVMGSEGSTVMNEKILDFLRGFNEEDKEILFITGKKQYADLNNNLKVNSSVKIVPFYENLSGLIKSSDLIISRAGASTISEIVALNIPSILVPSPYVANNHQYYNALSLKESGACEMILQDELTPSLLLENVKKILDDKEGNKKMIDNLKKLEVKDASTLIYNEIINK